MPKLKTKSGAAKRFRPRAGGRIKRSSANLRHILTKKSTKRKRNLRHAGVLSAVEARRAKTLLPYG